MAKAHVLLIEDAIEPFMRKQSICLADGDPEAVALPDAEKLMQKARVDAENYRYAIGPDASNDLAVRSEKSGEKALETPSTYALAAFLYEQAQEIRAEASHRKSPWILYYYFYFDHSSKEVKVKSRIYSARALNLAKRHDRSEPILIRLSNELVNHDGRGIILKFIDGLQKKTGPRLSNESRQNLVLIDTEWVDVYQQKRGKKRANENAYELLEYCKNKYISPTTLKECAMRLKEMGRNADALSIYEEMQRTHYDEDDND